MSSPVYSFSVCYNGFAGNNNDFIIFYRRILLLCSVLLCAYAASVLVVVLKWYDNNEADRTGDRGVGIYGIAGSE